MIVKKIGQCHRLPTIRQSVDSSASLNSRSFRCRALGHRPSQVSAIYHLTVTLYYLRTVGGHPRHSNFEEVSSSLQASLPLRRQNSLQSSACSKHPVPVAMQCLYSSIFPSQTLRRTLQILTQFCKPSIQALTRAVIPRRISTRWATKPWYRKMARSPYLSSRSHSRPA